MPTRTRTIASRNYTAGERIVDFPTVVENRFDQCKVSFLRESWPLTSADTVLTVIAESSPDNVNWTQIGSVTFPGGELTHPRTGEVITESWISFSFVPRAGQVRLRAINTATLRTTITVEVTS